MQLLRHSIEVHCEIDAAFKLCLDVKHWPGYFPHYKRIKILKQSHTHQLIEITAAVDDRVLTWQSARSIDPNSYNIHFRQIKPSPLLKKMEGDWRFYPLQEGILVSLEHQFIVKELHEGMPNGSDAKTIAIDLMEKTIHENSVRELKMFKSILESSPQPENSTSTVFYEHLEINKQAPLVYELLRNAKHWPELLPYCTEVDILYDDGLHQEFIMGFNASGQRESIRTIMRCVNNKKISYFQPNPPPILKQHHGWWLIESLANKTRVTAFHQIQLNPKEVKRIWGEIENKEALERIKKIINNNSLLTMQAIAAYDMQRKIA